MQIYRVLSAFTSLYLARCVAQRSQRMDTCDEYDVVECGTQSKSAEAHELL